MMKDKLFYKKPELKEHGKIKEITMGTSSGHGESLNTAPSHPH